MTYRSHWDEVPGHPVKDWRMEVANDNTRLGYLAWVKARENDLSLEQEEVVQPAPAHITKYRVGLWYKLQYFGHIDFDTEEEAQSFYDEVDYELIDTNELHLCENEAIPEKPKPIQFTKVTLNPPAWVGGSAIDTCLVESES